MTRGRGRSASDKVWATGLAVAACVGVVGSLGVRSASEADAASASDQEVPAETTSSDGLTVQQLNDYAAELRVERAALDAYRAELADVAVRLQGYAEAFAVVGGQQGLVASAANSPDVSSGVTASQGRKSERAEVPAKPEPVSVTRPEQPKPAANAPSAQLPAQQEPVTVMVQPDPVNAPAAVDAPPLQQAKPQPAPAPAAPAPVQKPQGTTKSS